MSHKKYIPNIPATTKKRVVVVGDGFAELKSIQKSLCAHYNWSWNYFTYDQSLRLLIKPKQRI